MLALVKLHVNQVSMIDIVYYVKRYALFFLRVKTLFWLTSKYFLQMCFSKAEG